MDRNPQLHTPSPDGDIRCQSPRQLPSPSHSPTEADGAPAEVAVRCVSQHAPLLDILERLSHRNCADSLRSALTVVCPKQQLAGCRAATVADLRSCHDQPAAAAAAPPVRRECPAPAHHRARSAPVHPVPAPAGLERAVSALLCELEERGRGAVEAEWAAAADAAVADSREAGPCAASAGCGVSPQRRHHPPRRPSPQPRRRVGSPASPSSAHARRSEQERASGLLLSVSSLLTAQVVGSRGSSSPTVLIRSVRGSSDWKSAQVEGASGPSSCGATLVIRDEPAAAADGDEDRPWRREGWMGETLPTGSAAAAAAPVDTDVLTEEHELMAHVSTRDAEEIFEPVGGDSGRGQLLGEGAYASVRLVRARIDCPPLSHSACGPKKGEEVAAKAVRLGELENAEDSIRDVVLNELVFLSAVARHKNLVAYRGSFMCRSKGELWCVLEYCSGASLGDLLFPHGRRRMVFTDGEAAAVCSDVLSGLSHMHSSGYAHRDLKPENILQSSSGVFKLSDFGLSRPCETGGVVTSASIEGTLMYLAPESFCTARKLLLGQSKCQTSHASDVYALGVCVLVMKGVNASRRIPHPELYVAPRWAPEAFGPERACLPRLLSSLLFDFARVCLQDKPSERATAAALQSHPFVVSYAVTGQMVVPRPLEAGQTGIAAACRSRSPAPHPQAHTLLLLAMASEFKPTADSLSA